MTLTQTIAFTKKASVVVLLLFLAYLILPGAIKGAINIAVPPRPQKAETAFGKLIEPRIPSLTFGEGSAPEYILDTKTGRLPKDIPVQAKVYKMAPPQTSALSGEKAKQIAQKFGFGGEPQRLGQTIYLWQDLKSRRAIKIDITSGNFVLETDINTLAPLTFGSPPDKSLAAGKANRVLETAGLLSADYASGRKEITYLSAAGGTLRKVDNIAEAQLTRIDFFREIEKQSILGPDPSEGLITIIIGEKDSVPFVVFRRWLIDTAVSSTYPLKSPEEAWSVLENGKAATTAAKSLLEPQTIYIREISLAYFDSGNFQEYLQPIYVFDGLALASDKTQFKYTAYVPAVAGDWLKPQP